MKKILFICSLLITQYTFSQDITGKWKTISDETKQVSSFVEIYKKDNLYYGKILLLPNKKNIDKCQSCKGKYYNVDLKGLEILKNLEKTEDKLYENGKILDPKSNKTYHCYIELLTNNKLKIRGYIGFSIFGRTQYWYRLNKNEETKLLQQLTEIKLKK